MFCTVEGACGAVVVCDSVCVDEARGPAELTYESLLTVVLLVILVLII